VATSPVSRDAGQAAPAARSPGAAPVGLGGGAELVDVDEGKLGVGVNGVHGVLLWVGTT
jgi:hypothetical protein